MSCVPPQVPIRSLAPEPLPDCIAGQTRSDRGFEAFSFSIYHLSFFVCHCRSVTTIRNDKLRGRVMNNDAERRGEGSEWKGEELFRLMVESVSDYSIFAIDPEGRVLSWNKGAEQIFGYRKEEIVGGSFAILFVPEDRRHGAPERALENARSRGRVRDDRWRMRKDGSRLWVSGS